MSDELGVSPNGCNPLAKTGEQHQSRYRLMPALIGAPILLLEARRVAPAFFSAR